jgi:hypothetical protein
MKYTSTVTNLTLHLNTFATTADSMCGRLL